MDVDIHEIAGMRKRLGLTQQQLAKKAGVSQSLVAKIESGKIDPRYSSVQQIVLALQKGNEQATISASEIMTRKIVSCCSEDSVRSIIQKMKRYEISQLPVVDGDVVKGVVTEGDILQAIVDHPHSELIAKDVMEDPPPILQLNTKDVVVSHLLSHYPLVLISKKDKLVGLISKSDYLRART